MISLSYYLDTRHVRKDGRAPLKLRAASNGASRLATIDIAIDPNDWDSKAQCVKPSNRYHRQYNIILGQKKLMLEMEVLRIEMAGLQGQEALNEVFKVIQEDDEPEPADKRPLIHEVFTRWINLKQKPGTRKVYINTYNLLHHFCPNFDQLYFEDITPGWLAQWDAFMARTAPKANARAVNLRSFRAVFNYAIDEEITQNYPFRRYKIKHERTAKRALTLEQIRDIFTVEVEPWQREYILTFRLIFLLIGINAVDLFNLETVSNGRIEYIRAKTGRTYSIKLEPEAAAIIKELRGKDHLLCMHDRYSSHANWLHRCNLGLQSIGEVKRVGRGGKKVVTPRWPGITTYWARHTWATIAASLDIPKETIAAALGHAQNSVTDIYIDFDMRKVDEANRRVIDWVLYGKQ